MTTLTISLKRPHPAQQSIIDAFDIHRFGVVACGRRFGKTEAGKIILIQAALAGKIARWFLPSHKMARETWTDIKRTLTDVTADKSEVDRRLELITGGIIQVHSAHDPDASRGPSADVVVLDEAAFMHPDVWQAVIRPMLSDRQGKALFLSSPNGRNWFWSLWMRGVKPEFNDWFSMRFETVANPLIPQSEVEDAQRSLPQRIFEQEYLAEFLADGGAVFRNVEACATLDCEQVPRSTSQYIFGVDWARESDFTCIAVMDKTRCEVVHVERFNQIGWSLQRGRLAALAVKWQPDVIWAEANSIGGPNIEALQAEGLPVVSFTTTAASKPPLIEGLALALERDEIALVRDPVLIGELQAYSMQRLPSGRFSYSAPPGEHDDTVIATALAWHGVTNQSGGGTWSASGKKL
jgi:phage terminase large subunit-like protein